MYLSSLFTIPFIENDYFLIIEYGLESMIIEFSNLQKGFVEAPKKMCFPCFLWWVYFGKSGRVGRSNDLSVWHADGKWNDF